MMLSCYLCILVAYWLSFIPQTSCLDTPSPHQYHIQTDEGPERYFRYQTDSGQYRKEKRLEDGTVIGTYAWIDDDGILRQRDYIADNAGYRILKTKNVYVGRNVNVGEAVKSIKKYPAEAGTLVKANQRPVITVPYSTPLRSTTYIPNSISHTTPTSVISTTARPYYSYTPVISTSPAGVIVTPTETPVVEITPNSYLRKAVLSTTPSILLEVPRNISSFSDNYLAPVTTELPYYQTVSPPTQYVPAQPSVQYVTATETDYNDIPPIYSKDVDQNSLDYNPYVRQVDNSYRFQNGPTYPLDQNGKSFIGQRIGNGYDPQYPTYDGVSVTNDGFRYYIPRAYHEEQTLPGDKRSGSFGYIDPFGIRRVIYYNTAPGTGFQHRKNNRYVGFQATPYDPRPY